MILGERLRTIREEKKLSQGDVEKRTGLLRCYVSRVENGHTVPSIETLEKLAIALQVPLYRLFYEGTETPTLPAGVHQESNIEKTWGDTGKHAGFFSKLRSLLGKMKENDRGLLLVLASKTAQKRKVG